MSEWFSILSHRCPVSLFDLYTIVASKKPQLIVSDDEEKAAAIQSMKASSKMSP